MLHMFHYLNLMDTMQIILIVTSKGTWKGTSKEIWLEVRCSRDFKIANVL